mgnify:CR=1 FL=1
MNLIKGFSFFGLCFSFIVIALGAWTRLVDAGLGCPDWPGCYGFVVFPTSEVDIALAEQRYPNFPYEINKVIPEVIHRYFAATLGLISILLVTFSLKNKLPSQIKYIALFLLFFICCQGLFGYLTVSLKLLPLIVTIHLFGGFALINLGMSFLSFILMLYFKYFGGKSFIETPLPELTILFFMIGTLSIFIGLIAEIIIRTYFSSYNFCCHSTFCKFIISKACCFYNRFIDCLYVFN